MREAATLEEANRLLAQGFVLVKVMDRMVYVVGLPKEASRSNGSNNGKNEQQPEHPSTESTILGSLHWKKFKNGGGEWAFLLGPDDSLLPELEPTRQFIEKLKNTPDGDGSLLDHMVILYGGGLSDGNSHLHDNLPVLVAGGASGQLKGGRHIRYPKDTPMPNLLLTMLGMLGVQQEKLGDSTGHLSLA